jgi:O-methyltransferase
MLLKVWRTPGFNGFFNTSLRYAPRPIRSLVERERLAARVGQRHRAVPEAAYRALLRRGLQELVALSDGKPVGDYLEFGVYNGTSLVSAYRETEALGLGGLRLFGFDSFQGLPVAAATDDNATWKPGDWCADLPFTEAVLAAEGVDRNRVVLIPGWFSDTLKAATSRAYGIATAAVIMVDCDIYTSAREALDFCTPLIGDRALVLFDDWHSGGLAARNLGERKAFEEWLTHCGCFTAEPFGSYSSKSETFMVTRM